MNNAVAACSAGLGAQARHPGRWLPRRGQGQGIQFALGYSHPILFPLPEGVTAEVDKVARTEDSLPTLGPHPAVGGQGGLGSTAVKIRALRPPEPYKGKGIKYAEETIRRKEGKTGIPT